MKISISIVTCGRFEVFRRCCSSVAQALPKDAEVVVMINGDLPETKKWLREWNHPQFRYLSVPRESLARSRNRAFFHCQGEILYCLDDDVEVPLSLFEDAIEFFECNPKITCVGGPNLTPTHSTFSQALFGAVMTSPFAAPLIRRRYSPAGLKWRIATERDLIFCNLAFRRSLLPRGIYFREYLRSNEESSFLYECSRLGSSIAFHPRLAVFHQRRKSLFSFLKQVYSYGYGRAQQTLGQPLSCHPAFLVPVFSVLLLGCSLIFPPLRPLVASLVVIHLILSVWGSQYMEGNVKLFGKILCVPLTGLLHLGYGWGFFIGVLKGGKILLSGKRAFLRSRHQDPMALPL